MWVTGLLRKTWRKKGHPAWKHSGSGVVFLKPGFPSFPLTSAQTACESVTVQGMIQTQVRKKVKYLVHSCSVFIFIVVQGSSPSFPPCLFWSWHTSTHPSPHTLPTQTDRHTPFLFVGYNSRRQAFGSLIFKMTLLTLPPHKRELYRLQLAVPGILRVAVHHLAPALRLPAEEALVEDALGCTLHSWSKQNNATKQHAISMGQGGST